MKTSAKRRVIAGAILLAMVPFPGLHARPAANRLIHETSPYLLQHAHNPVDWYPWGAEAFEKARKEDKPIFLSVGYSTCHWCHVMERESFENPAIAAILNGNFVSIKVDREERPDIDQVYMAFVQATTGGGGWPMSLWLTPDGKPLAGGTYFPPEDRMGRPGLKTVLLEIAKSWKDDRKGLTAASQESVIALQNMAAHSTSADGKIGANLREKAFQKIAADFDAKNGGFGVSPKFPQPQTLDFLFRVYASGPASESGRRALEMALLSLRRMAAGGIHDQLGGGFHRYTVDDAWRVPHFEKMLYDQAQLAGAYLTAFQITHDPVFEKTARDILDCVRRDMTDAAGGFRSAEDADSLLAADKPEHAEGAFYVWTKDEIDNALGPKRAKIFEFHYGVETNGNVPAENDAQGELAGKNILFQRHDLAETAKEFDLSEKTTAALLAESRGVLLAARAKRPRPRVDDKIVTGWNGLMISAFARAYQVLGDEAYLETANRAADFAKTNLTQDDGRTLARSYCAGAAKGEGFADDYAFLIQGLLDLYEASFDPARLAWAGQLQQTQNELFWDDKQGGYFASTGNDPRLLVRMKQDHDEALPSANSVAAANLIRLEAMLDKPDWRGQAEKTVRAFLPQIEQSPQAMPQMIGALEGLLSEPKQIVIAGKPDAADTKAMLREVRSRYLPNKIVLLADGSAELNALSPHVKLITGATSPDGKATVYVCENFACHQPTTDPARLAALLSGEKAAAGKVR